MDVGGKVLGYFEPSDALFERDEPVDYIPPMKKYKPRKSPKNPENVANSGSGLGTSTSAITVETSLVNTGRPNEYVNCESIVVTSRPESMMHSPNGDATDNNSYHEPLMLNLPSAIRKQNELLNSLKRREVDDDNSSATSYRIAIIPQKKAKSVMGTGGYVNGLLKVIV